MLPLPGNFMKQFKYLAILFFATTSTYMQASWQDWYDDHQAQIIRATSRLQTLDMVRANAQENNQLNEKIIPLKEVICELDTNTAVVKNGSQSVTGKIIASYLDKQVQTSVKITRTATDKDRSNTIDFNHAVKALRLKARNEMVKYNVPADIIATHQREYDENL